MDSGDRRFCKTSPLFYARGLPAFIYLLAMALGIFSQVFVLGRMVMPGDAAATANNILAFEGLFRLGIAVDVITFVSDVVIAWAFYELLNAVDKSLALLGAFLRIADGAILAVTTFSGLITLRLLSGVDYLRAFDANQLQSLARLFVSARGLGFDVGFVFLGLGSTRSSPTCCSSHDMYQEHWLVGGSSRRWRWRLARSR